MPELPEVETVVRELHRHLVGRTLGRLSVWQPRVLESPEAAFRRATVHSRVVAVRRRGKWILLDLQIGQTILAHLRMTGRLSVTSARAPRARHDHLEWLLESGPDCIRFNDPRRFGRFRLVPTADVESYLSLRGFGPEPLDIDFEEFHRRLGKGRRSIKAALLDQRVVAGIGNIYADETLFRAGIDPRLPTSRLGPARARRIHEAMKSVLERAITLRGTTLRNFRTPEGAPGDFQSELAVFRKTGSPCPACRHAVKRIKLAGRSTHFCPACQTR
jgi:formamidopyrimidine-DNA glycosylase